MKFWQFLQDQILGMKWLNALIGNGLEAMGIDTGGRIGGSIQFFVYDVLKITVLLCVLIFLISYLQSFFPPERSRRILGRFHGIGANVVSALLGTVTPFCSCSSIPPPWGKNPLPRAAYGLGPLPSKLSYPVGGRVRGLRPPRVRPRTPTSRHPRPSVPAFPSVGRPNQRPFFRRSAACSRAVFWS